MTVSYENKKGSNSPKHIYDVLIVGAGPVGLATAVGLHKRGITNILVLDQAQEFRRVGQGVDLLPNGLRAIKYIDVEAYQKIKDAAFNAVQTPGDQNSSRSSDAAQEKSASSPKRFWRQRNLRGETTRSFPTDFQSWFDRYGEG